MSESITYAEWTAALQAALASQPGDEGLDKHQIAEALKLSDRRAGDFLRALHAAGKLVAGKAYRPAIDGRRLAVPVYRLKS